MFKLLIASGTWFFTYATFEVTVEQFIGIAPALHTRIGQADESILQAMLREQAARYYLQASLEGHS